MKQLGEISGSSRPESRRMIRYVSLWLSIGLILTISTGLLTSGVHENYDGVDRAGEITHFGRPFGWRLVVHEFRLGRGEIDYTKYNAGYFLLDLLVYTVLAIFIVDFFENRIKHSLSEQ